MNARSLSMFASGLLILGVGLTAWGINKDSGAWTIVGIIALTIYSRMTWDVGRKS